MASAISPSKLVSFTECRLPESRVHTAKVSDFCRNFEAKYNYPLEFLTNCESLDEVELFFLGDCHNLLEPKLNNTKLIQLLWNEQRKIVFHEAPRTYTAPPPSIVATDLNPAIRYFGWDDQDEIQATVFNHSGPHKSLLVNVYEAAAFVERIRGVIEKDLKAPFHKGSTHDSLEVIAKELDHIFHAKRKELESFSATTPQLKAVHKACTTYTPYPKNPLRLLNCARLLCSMAFNKLEEVIPKTWKLRQKSLCSTLTENGQKGFVIAGDTHFVDLSTQNYQIEKTLQKHLHHHRVKYCIIVPRVSEIMSRHRNFHPIQLNFRGGKPPTNTTMDFHSLPQIIEGKINNLAHIIHYFYDSVTGDKIPDPLLGKRAIVYMRLVRELFKKGRIPIKVGKLQKRYNKRNIRLYQIKQMLKEKDKYSLKQIRQIRKQHLRTASLLKKLAKQIQS